MPKGQEKDISKTNPVHQIESQASSKDVSNILNILDSHIVRTNPFGANVSGETSYRRAERISAALHLITNHVPEGEPLRSSIRQDGLQLLTNILNLREGFRSAASEKGEALAVIRELVSLTRLLAVSGYVSPSNATAVVEALDELGNLIVISQRSTLAEQLTISRGDLVPAAQSTYRTPQFESRSSRPRPRPVKDISKPVESVTDSARSDRILDILRLGGVLGIKDIAANLPQYSEKMIQRELAELVRLDKVTKQGEKRWSRYQINA